MQRRLRSLGSPVALPPLLPRNRCRRLGLRIDLLRAVHVDNHLVEGASKAEGRAVAVAGGNPMATE